MRVDVSTARTARCALLFANLRDWVKKKNTANTATTTTTTTATTTTAAAAASTIHHPEQADEPADGPLHAPAAAAAPPALSRIDREIDIANDITENLVGEGGLAVTTITGAAARQLDLTHNALKKVAPGGGHWFPSRILTLDLDLRFLSIVLLSRCFQKWCAS